MSAACSITWTYPRRWYSRVATALIPFPERRCKPCADGIQHAASGRSASDYRGSGRWYWYGSEDRGRLWCLRSAKHAGVVERSESNRIIIRCEDGTKDEYRLTKFARSNQSNCYNQRPIVFKGDRVEAGDVIADGASTSNGEIALR